MAVALDNLGCQACSLNTEFFAYIFFNKRVDIGISADSAGKLANGNKFAGLFQAFHIAFGFIHPQRKFQAEGHRFSMNAVRAANHNGVFVFCGAAF